MAERDSSRTALGVAFLRAAHQLIDDPPRILDDPIIVKIIGTRGVDTILASAERYQAPGARALRSHVVLRSRFAEDRLEAAVKRGISQYIILGAGFDTFAYRQPAWASGIRVIEVDHPASQGEKRKWLSGAGVDKAENVVFADVDFEHESLRDGLLRHGISLGEPTFCSWLGVTMYLTMDAIDAVFRTVAEFPSGSEIVLTFAPKENHANPEFDGPSLAQRAAHIGEPWLSYFDMQSLDALLRTHGFREVEFLRSEDADARYFRGRSDGLPAPRRTTIAAAVR